MGLRAASMARVAHPMRDLFARPVSVVPRLPMTSVRRCLPRTSLTPEFADHAITSWALVAQPG